MSYYAITFKSKKLKRSIVYIDILPDLEENKTIDNIDSIFDANSSEPEVKMSRKERRAQKKQLKEEQKRTRSLEPASENIYVINGEDVAEEDLTKEEREDIEANKLLNQDHFYDPLEPLDWGVKTKTKAKVSPGIIAAGIAGIVALIGILAFICSSILSF